MFETFYIVIVLLIRPFWLSVICLWSSDSQ